MGQGNALYQRDGLAAGFYEAAVCFEKANGSVSTPERGSELQGVRHLRHHPVRL